MNFLQRKISRAWRKLNIVVAAKADQRAAQGSPFYGKRFLFFPEGPHLFALIYRVVPKLGGVIKTSGNGQDADFVLLWKDATFRDPVPTAIAGTHRVINGNCVDISKQAVEAVSQSVFGYGLSVDPTTYEGDLVVKSDLNGQHDGQVITGPLPTNDPGKVYQIIINNEVEGDMVEDLRLPVIGGRTAICYRKVRPRKSRFSNQNYKTELHLASEFFDQEQLSLIVRFTQEIGLDVGELDVLRDRITGKIYVVDVNNTPFGPPNGLTAEDSRRALDELSGLYGDFFSKWLKSN